MKNLKFPFFPSLLQLANYREYGKWKEWIFDALTRQECDLKLPAP